MVGRYDRPTGFELPNAARSPWLLTAANSLWATKCCPQVRLYCPDPAVRWNCTALQVNKITFGWQILSGNPTWSQVNFQQLLTPLWHLQLQYTIQFASLVHLNGNSVSQKCLS